MIIYAAVQLDISFFSHESDDHPFLHGVDWNKRKQRKIYTFGNDKLLN